MRYEIQLEMPPCGYAMTAARKDENVNVQGTGFYSSEDGQDFVARLEGLPDHILFRLPNGQWPIQSQIDHMLVIIKPDNKAMVYINELKFVMKVRPSRNVTPGMPVGPNDIVDILAMDFQGVEIPAEAGVMVIFSRGWRKGFFFDLAPIGPHPSPRTFDIKATLGHLYAYLTFQEKFAILEAEWDRLFAEKWFPFIGLDHATVLKMIAFIRQGWPIDDMVSDIVIEVKRKASGFLESWRRHRAFGGHLGILEKAVERFLADDPISCSGLLYSRIEGLLRSNYFASGETVKPTAKNLAASAVKANVDRDYCLFLPKRFLAYLETVYFASFEPQDLHADISRNTVGHRVADVGQFDVRSAAIAILVTHQLFYCFPAGEIHGSDSLLQVALS